MILIIMITIIIIIMIIRFCCAPEFDDNRSNCRSLDEPSVTQPVRVLETHMPQHHVKYSETAKYLCIIRDPVNTLGKVILILLYIYICIYIYIW
jgi:hypothetical protein